MKSNMNMGRTVIRTASAIGLAALAFAAPVLGQQNADPLKGPEVKDQAVPGTVGQFGGAETKGKFAQREVRPMVFMEAVKKALGPDAPEDVRMSPEQQTKLRALAEDYRTQVQAYMKSRGADGEKVRKALAERAKGAKGAKGGKDAAKGTEGANTGDMQDMAAKAEELRAGMPSASDMYTKAWEILSAKQRAAVEARIEEFKHQREVEEGKEYVARKLKKAEPVEGQTEGLAKEKGKFAGAAKGQGESAGARVPAEVRERFLRLLEKMTPEQREQLLQRIEERMQAGGREAPQGERGRGERKPAPSGKDIEVPKPE